jgi:hypothetical protein
MKKYLATETPLKLLTFGQAFYLIKLLENQVFPEIVYSSCAAIVVGVLYTRPIPLSIIFVRSQLESEKNEF